MSKETEELARAALESAAIVFASYQDSIKESQGMWCVEIDEHINASVAVNKALCNQGNIKKAMKRLKKSYKALKKCVVDDEYTKMPG